MAALKMRGSAINAPRPLLQAHPTCNTDVSRIILIISSLIRMGCRELPCKQVPAATAPWPLGSKRNGGALPLPDGQ
jgi:hypothetical protein